VPAVGLVFLDDLAAFAPWASDRAPAWCRERRLDGPLLPPTVEPPPVVVVVLRDDAWAQLASSAAWLEGARAQVLVVEPSRTAPTPRAEGLAHLSRVHAVVMAEPEGLDRALGEAHVLAARLADSAWPALPSIEPAAAVAPGPWLSWLPPTYDDRPPELVETLQHLAPALCRPGGRPMLLDGARGHLRDLLSGARRPIPGLAGRVDAWRPVAAAPDGQRWLRASSAREVAWTLEGVGTTPGGYGRPIGIDAGGRLAWGGGRAWFHWRVLTPAGAVYWTPSSHDWPCGHAKKLYGHEDNEPIAVQLARDGRACASTYAHDTLLTPGLPLVWRDTGALAVAERARGEPRALLFARDDGEATSPGDPWVADEDARDRWAPVVVGPSDDARYAVALDGPTYRLAGGRVERLGDRGWVLFDAAHQVVRRGEARLLGGWDRWVVLLDGEGRLVREDLLSGAREALGEAERAVAAAVPLVGTPNVVLLGLDEGCAVRVV
jgi:hypothetical protein